MGYNADSYIDAPAVRRQQVPIPPTVTPVSGLPSATNYDGVDPTDLTHRIPFKKQPIRQPIGPTSYSDFINRLRSTKLSLEAQKTLERRVEAIGSKGQSSPQVQDHASGELRRNATLQKPTGHLKAQGTCYEPSKAHSSIAQPATLEVRPGMNAQYQSETRRAYLGKTQHPSETDSRPFDSSEVAPVNSPSSSGMWPDPDSYYVHPSRQDVVAGGPKLPGPGRITVNSKTQSPAWEYLPRTGFHQAPFTPAVRANESDLSTAHNPPVPFSAFAAPPKLTPSVSGTNEISDKTRQSIALTAKAARGFLLFDPANHEKVVPELAAISTWLLQGVSFEELCDILETRGFAIDRALWKPRLFAVCPELKNGGIGQVAAGTTKPPVSAAQRASSTANRTHIFQPQISGNAFARRSDPAITYSNNPQQRYNASVQRGDFDLQQRHAATNNFRSNAGLYQSNAFSRDLNSAMDANKEEMDKIERYLAQLPDLATVQNRFKTQNGARNDDDGFCVVGDPVEDDSEWDFVDDADAI